MKHVMTGWLVVVLVALGGGKALLAAEPEPVLLYDGESLDAVKGAVRDVYKRQPQWHGKCRFLRWTL